MTPYKKELTEYFSSKDSIIIAYLSGSTVHGDTGGLSDVDIGVMMDEKLSKKDRIAPSVGLRNILVHMYTKIDIGRFYYYLQNNIDDIEQYIAQYLTTSSH